MTMTGWRCIRVDQLPDIKTIRPYSFYKLPDESFWYPDDMEGNATKWLTSDQWDQQRIDNKENNKQICLTYFQIDEQVDMTKWNEFATKNPTWKTLSGRCFVRKIEEDEKCSTGVRITVQDIHGQEVAVDTMWVNKL